MLRFSSAQANHRDDELAGHPPLRGHILSERFDEVTQELMNQTATKRNDFIRGLGGL